MEDKIVIFERAKQPAPRMLSIDQIVDPESEWEKVAEVYGHIEGMNFDRQGRMWMVSTPKGQIIRIDNGKPVVVGPSEDAPNGMAFHKDGRLFVADKVGKIYWVDPESGERHLIADRYKNGHFSGLNDCCFDTRGGFYFTEPYGTSTTNPTGRVFYLPPDGKAEDIVCLMENVAFPNGICCAPHDERLFVAEFARNRVLSAQCVPPANKSEPNYVFCTYTGGVGPDGICVDSDGNLYCAHFGATEVVVCNPEGFLYGAIRLPEHLGVHSDNLAFHGNYLYVQEGQSNTVWRIRLKTHGPKLYSDM